MATAYAVAAWIVAQVVSVVDEPLGLPSWFEAAVLVLLAIGFPIAAILAWGYELTPDGVRQTSHATPTDSASPVTGQGLNYVVTALLVLAVAFLVVDDYVLEPGAPTQAAASTTAAVVPAEGARAAVPSALRELQKIAVLPCDNLSPDPADSYFAAGIHEEILNQLAKIGSLLVVARTSVLQYAQTRPAIPEIAQELNASAIVECSVRYAGDDILVTAQLIDPETDAHMWSETYPGNLSDLSAVFAMQADIAMNIANALEAEFSQAEMERLLRGSTTSPEAYALFLQALAADGVERQIALLQEAVRIDPNFAAAHAAIAVVFAQGATNTIANSASGAWSAIEARAIESAERALALDPDLAAAHSARAILHEIVWRWPEARAAHRRALELNPSNPLTLWRANWFFAFSGARNEAIALAARLVALQPRNPQALANAAVAYAAVGETAAAFESCEAALALDPNFIFCHHGQGLQYRLLGDNAAAEAEFRTVERLLGGNRVVAFLPQLAVGYSLIGREADVSRLVTEVEAIAETIDIGAGGYATLYLAAGDRARTLEWLRAALDKVARNEPDAGYYDLMTIKNNVYGHPMLEEPEFQAIRSRLGVP